MEGNRISFCNLMRFGREKVIAGKQQLMVLREKSSIQKYDGCIIFPARA